VISSQTAAETTRDPQGSAGPVSDLDARAVNSNNPHLALGGGLEVHRWLAELLVQIHMAHARRKSVFKKEEVDFFVGLQSAHANLASIADIAAPTPRLAATNARLSARKQSHHAIVS
jgi:hypothetical protein